MAIKYRLLHNNLRCRAAQVLTVVAQTTAGPRPMRARVVASDPQSDLAVLQCETSSDGTDAAAAASWELVPPKFGRSAALKVRQAPRVCVRA